MTSKFLKLKKKKNDYNNKDIKNIFQQKKIYILTTHDMNIQKLKLKNIYSYITKLKETKEKQVKKNYLLHGRTLLIEGIFQDIKKFVQLSLKPKIPCLKKRNS